MNFEPKMKEVQKNNLLTSIVALIKQSQQQVLRAVNSTMVYTYFEIGKMIVEEEQNGKERAEYGKQILKVLSEHLTNEFGKGFSVDNLQQMRKFYLSYSIPQTLSAKSEIYETASSISQSKISDTLSRIFKLNWSHYTFLIRIDNELERNLYEIESFKNNWSVRELKRQYNSALFTRLPLSKNKEEVLQLAQKGQLFEIPNDFTNQRRI